MPSKRKPAPVPKTPLTKHEIAAVETLNPANPVDRVLLGLFHRLAFPEKDGAPILPSK